MMRIRSFGGCGGIGCEVKRRHLRRLESALLIVTFPQVGGSKASLPALTETVTVRRMVVMRIDFIVAIVWGLVDMLGFLD
jgi:hypothetical protein